MISPVTTETLALKKETSRNKEVRIETSLKKSLRKGSWHMFETTSRIYLCRTSSHTKIFSTLNLHSKILSKKIIWTNKTLNLPSQKYAYPKGITNISPFLDHRKSYGIDQSLAMPSDIDSSFAIIQIGISLIIIFNIILLHRSFDRGKDLSWHLHGTSFQSHRTFSSSHYDFARSSHHLILSMHNCVRLCSFRIDHQVPLH